MTQTSNYVIDNASGASVRSDLNNVLASAVSLNAGTTAPVPSPTGSAPQSYAYMLWADTNTAVKKLKMRNGSNTAWIEIGDLDQNALNIVANKFPNVTSLVNATSAELNILDGVTASTSEINTLDGITASTSELNKLDGVTASTAEINILDGVTASTADLNIIAGITLKDEDSMTSNSATAIATQQSIKAYVDDGIPRLTPRKLLWIGGNDTTSLSGALFSEPITPRQGYDITPSSHFGLSSGQFIKIDFQLECINAEDGHVVGDIINRHGGATPDGNNGSWCVWHTHSGDFSNSSMRIKFNLGDDPLSALMHHYTRPERTAFTGTTYGRGSSNNTNYQSANFALYATIYYTL